MAFENEEIGFKINVDEGNSQQTVKSFKQELKEATAQAVQMAREFGELSPQSIAAAKNLGKLKEEMADVNELVSAVTDEKRFQAFAGLAGSLAGGFSAVQGAIGLVAGESEQLEKIMLRVQSAMALSQGLSQVAEIGRMWGVARAALMSFSVVQKANNILTASAATIQKLFTGSVNTTSTSFKVLKGAMAATGIGLLVAGVAALVTNFGKLKDAVLNLIPGLKEVVGFISDVFTGVSDFLGLTSEAERAAEDLEKRILSQNDAHEENIRLLEASGATSKEVRQAKKVMYQEEIFSLLRIKDLNKELSEDQEKRLRELNLNLKVFNAEQARENREAAEEAKKKADDDKKKADEELKRNSERRKAENKKAAEDRKQKAEEAARELEAAKQKEIDALKDKNAFELQLLEAQGQSVAGVREKQIDAEIELLKASGGKFTEGIIALEREKVLVAAKAKADAEAKIEEERKAKEEKDKEIKAEQDAIADELRKEGEATDLIRMEEKYAAMRAVVAGNEELTTAVIAAQAEERAAITKKWDDIILEQKRENANKLAGILGSISTVVGKETAVGKGLAIAEATISTYLGATKALAGVNSKNPFGAALAIAQAAAIVASGFKSIKEIVKTKVPGVGGSSSGGEQSAISSASSSPAVSTAPTMDGIQSTLVDQTKQLTEGKDALKAYVVESEITQSQERQKAITQTANF